MKIRAVIFDMDGVLIDTTELIYRAIEDVLAEHNVNVSRNDIARVTGKPVQGIYSLLAPDLDPAELENKHLEHHAENKHLIKAYSGVAEVLVSLRQKGYKLGVFTGFSQLAYERLDQFDLRRYFDAIVENTMYTAHKPDPEGLLLCMELLGVRDPKSVAYIGDGIADVMVGKNAGVAVNAGITCGFSDRATLIEQKPDYIIDSLHEFEDILDTIG